MTSIDRHFLLNYKHIMSLSKLTHIVWILIFLAGCLPTTPPLTEAGTASPSSAQTFTDTPFPSLTPTASPTPETRVANAEQALFNGDYEHALIEFQAALANSSDPTLQAAALWGLGRTNHRTKNYGAALLNLNRLIADFSASPHRPQAHLVRGEILLKLGRYTEAIEAYSAYLFLKPGVLDAYVFEQRGHAYAALGDYADAIADYQAALNSPHIGDDTYLQIELARTYEQAGDATTALGMYDAIAAASSSDYVKAQMDLLSGQLYEKLGQTTEAYARYQHAVDNYPLAYDSYTALVSLVNAGVPVDELNRGLIDYFAGQYGYAYEAFRRYLAATPDHDGTAYYYSALALREMGQYQEAINTFSAFIENYPENRYWDAAWDEKAYIQWAYLGQYEAAAQTLLDYARLKPDPALAPQALLNAGRIYERAGLLDQAAATWESIANTYPGSDLVPQALFWAGIVRYRAGHYNDALVTFQRSRLFSLDPADQARATFWSGKTSQVLGDTQSARLAFEQAALIDPTDYYSLRAQDALFGRSIFELPAAYDLKIDLPAERANADAWLRVTFGLPPETDLTGLGSLETDPRWVRGREFWELGLFSEARAEFESLRESVSDNAEQSYRLGNALLELGAYRPAIFALRQVLSLAGMKTQADTLAAPRYFNLVRYGTYYADLVLPAAQTHGLHPLWLFAIMRQESLFEGFVRSEAGARGLMQITPSTGQEIAAAYGWPPNYSDEDLYRPIVSIRFGAYYLRSKYTYFGNELPTALAAYNAGPGNAQIWRNLSGPDPDLFIETIRFAETRDYLRSIYEIYWMYRYLYEITP